MPRLRIGNTHRVREALHRSGGIAAAQLDGEAICLQRGDRCGRIAAQLPRECRTAPTRARRRRATARHRRRGRRRSRRGRVASVRPSIVRLDAQPGHGARRHPRDAASSDAARTHAPADDGCRAPAPRRFAAPRRGRARRRSPPTPARGRPLAERAGLVEHDAIHPRQRCKRIAHAAPARRSAPARRVPRSAPPGSPATARKDSSPPARPAPLRARAPGRAGATTDTPPMRTTSSAITKRAGDAIGQARQRRAVRLRLFDQARQLRQPRVAATRRTRRRAGMLAAYAAGQCGLAGLARTGVDSPVSSASSKAAGRPAARRRPARASPAATQRDVAHAAARRARSVRGRRRGLARGQRRPRPRQRIDLRAGDAARALLEHARHQQQQHEHHRRVVPDVRPAAQRLEQAGEVGEQGRAGDQRVHARARRPRSSRAHAGEERPAANRTPPASTPGR